MSDAAATRAVASAVCGGSTVVTAVFASGRETGAGTRRVATRAPDRARPDERQCADHEQLAVGTGDPDEFGEDVGRHTRLRSFRVRPPGSGDEAGAATNAASCSGKLRHFPARAAFAGAKSTSRKRASMTRSTPGQDFAAASSVSTARGEVGGGHDIDAGSLRPPGERVSLFPASGGERHVGSSPRRRSPHATWSRRGARGERSSSIRSRADAASSAPIQPRSSSSSTKRAMGHQALVAVGVSVDNARWTSIRLAAAASLSTAVAPPPLPAPAAVSTAIPAAPSPCWGRCTGRPTCRREAVSRPDCSSRPP